jgi:hypothetical protein
MEKPSRYAANDVLPSMGGSAADNSLAFQPLGLPKLCLVPYFVENHPDTRVSRQDFREVLPL